MSKILDILKNDNDNNIDYVQEQLAEIYISPTKKKELVDKKDKKNVRRLYIGWLGVILALSTISLVLLALLLFTNKINVNVTVIREARVDKELFLDTTLEETASSLNLISLPINRITFNGSASTESKLQDEYLYLVNSRGSGWANVQIEFEEPLNATDTIFSFSAKGQRGREHLLIILKDANNHTYQSIDVVPTGLSKDWENFKIDFNKTARWIDIQAISQIRLEFGSITANNPVTAAIYIKDFLLNKERRP